MGGHDDEIRLQVDGALGERLDHQTLKHVCDGSDALRAQRSDVAIEELLVALTGRLGERGVKHRQRDFAGDERNVDAGVDHSRQVHHGATATRNLRGHRNCAVAERGAIEGDEQVTIHVGVSEEGQQGNPDERIPLVG